MIDMLRLLRMGRMHAACGEGDPMHALIGVDRECDRARIVCLACNGASACSGDLLDEDALGVRGAAVWGVVGKAAVAGTSPPSFRRCRSSLARRCEISDGASEVDEPDAVEGALDTMEGATESTDPRFIGGQRYI